MKPTTAEVINEMAAQKKRGQPQIGFAKRLPFGLWRVGQRVLINVYDGHDRPVCQCHTAADALLIVMAVNALKQGGTK